MVVFFAVGLVAQLIDGALGMAFGLTATTFMLSFGTSPLQASAMIHIAEIFTTAASGTSHFAHRNIDWTIVKRIAVPGTIGGIVGATVLVHIDGNVVAPFVAAYLGLLGIVILARALNKFTPRQPQQRGMPVLGFVGGVLDAIGGGGWGAIVTGTLIGHGHSPRLAIGSVNLAEFLVTIASSAAFVLTLGFADLVPVIPLILGGVVSAPFAGYLTRIAPTRLLMGLVGSVILFLSLRSLLKFVGWL